MGWELRAGKLYYYRKRRDDSDRVQSQYLGRGQKAVDASREDGVTVPDEVLALLGPVAQQPEAPATQVATADLLAALTPAPEVVPYYRRAAQDESFPWLRYRRGPEPRRRYRR